MKPDHMCYGLVYMCVLISSNIRNIVKPRYKFIYVLWSLVRVMNNVYHSEVSNMFLKQGENILWY